MGQISQELITFKSKVEPALSPMTTTISEIVMKMTNINSVTSSTKDSFSSVYKSKNKKDILGKFDRIREIYGEISNSVANDLTPILENSKTLIAVIGELEKLNAEIASHESTIASLEGQMWSYSTTRTKEAVDSHNSSISGQIKDEKTAIASIEQQFNSKHEEARRQYNTLRGQDSSITMVKELPAGLSNVTASQIEIQNGKFEKHTFQASNGLELSYYLYVPENVTQVSSLPVHLYLHGSGECRGVGVTAKALPKLLAEGMDTEGIVICPQIKEYSSKYNNDATEDAIMELTKSVVNTYHADANRVSLGGHSMGAIVGYEMISRYPNTFSAFIPISGRSTQMDDYENTGMDALSKVKVWAFHGTHDAVVDYSLATSTLEDLEKRGYHNMNITAFKGENHGIQNKIYNQKYNYNGQMYNPLTWAFSQVKG